MLKPAMIAAMAMVATPVLAQDIRENYLSKPSDPNNFTSLFEG